VSKRPKPPMLYGMLERGNIDPLKRPIIHNADGSYSTTRSMSFEEDGVQVLVPTIAHDGKVMSNEEAVRYYHKTGEHLGKFDTPANADRSAVNIHNYQAQFYTKDGKIRTDPQDGATDTIERHTPFTELYPKWDAPTFDPNQTYIRPKKIGETSNRSVMSRLYEHVLDSFSDARQKLLREQIDREKRSEPPQVWGSRGSVPGIDKIADAGNDPPPQVWGSNG
jgi:hypothetical protein